MYLVTYEYLNIASEWLPGASVHSTFGDAEDRVSEDWRNVEFFERNGDTWIKVKL